MFIYLLVGIVCSCIQQLHSNFEPKFFRFLPDGIYLDAVKLGIEKLAPKMYEIITNPSIYYNFFKWHGHYTFHDTADDNYSYTVCELCAFLNNVNREHSKLVYENIIDWWNVPTPKDFKHIDSFLSYPLYGSADDTSDSND